MVQGNILFVQQIGSGTRKQTPGWCYYISQIGRKSPVEFGVLLTHLRKAASVKDAPELWRRYIFFITRHNGTRCFSSEAMNAVSA